MSIACSQSECAVTVCTPPCMTLLWSTCCRLQRFQDINGQLNSFDKDTLKQVDDACKEVARNCELLAIIKTDLHSIFKRIRCIQPCTCG